MSLAAGMVVTNVAADRRRIFADRRTRRSGNTVRIFACPARKTRNPGRTVMRGLLSSKPKRTLQRCTSCGERCTVLVVRLVIFSRRCPCRLTKSGVTWTANEIPATRCCRVTGTVVRWLFARDNRNRFLLVGCWRRCLSHELSWLRNRTR